MAKKVDGTEHATIIWFTGRVQGVGFRQITRELARDLPLAGTVCNCADGRVKLVVHGAGEAIATLRTRIHERFGRQITHIEEATTTVNVPAAGADGPEIRIVHES